MTHRILGFASLICPCLLTVSSAWADTPTGHTYSLFDGRTLWGWQVTGCEVAVEDNAIVLKSGNGLVRTAHRYSDFVLEFQWNALRPDNWDSGVYFRFELPPEGVTWPKRYQVNLRKGMEGNVGSLEGATSNGLVRPGQWNHFKFTVIGPSAALEINGKPAWKADGLEAASGYIALQSEVPGGGSFAFRDLSITELGYKPIFNGRDFSGWEAAAGKPEASWKVDDDTLICTGRRGSWLRSLEEFGDFNLRLEYKVTPGGNSGVFVRIPPNAAHIGPGDGVEIQVLDDRHPRYANLNPYQFTGSVYGVAPAKTHVGNPAGQWNSLEINCHGADYRTVHNGVVIVDAKADEFPPLEQRRRHGFLGLQNHSEEVWFRNLRIGPPQR